MYFRPEEKHRASRVNDVFPPERRWNCKMSDCALLRNRMIFADLKRKNFTAISAGGFNVCIRMKRGRDPEGIPCAICIKRFIADFHLVLGYNSGKRRSHPNL